MEIREEGLYRLPIGYDDDIDIIGTHSLLSVPNIDLITFELVEKGTQWQLKFPDGETFNPDRLDTLLEGRFEDVDRKHNGDDDGGDGDGDEGQYNDVEIFEKIDDNEGKNGDNNDNATTSSRNKLQQVNNNMVPMLTTAPVKCSSVYASRFQQSTVVSQTQNGNSPEDDDGDEDDDDVDIF